MPSIVGLATTLGEGSVSIKGAVIACAAGVGLAAAIALPSVIERGETTCPPDSELVASRTAVAGQGGGHGDEHGHDHGHGGRHLLVGPSCNLVETAAPPDSKYRPTSQERPGPIDSERGRCCAASTSSAAVTRPPSSPLRGSLARAPKTRRTTSTPIGADRWGWTRRTRAPRPCTGAGSEA